MVLVASGVAGATAGASAGTTASDARTNNAASARGGASAQDGGRLNQEDGLKADTSCAATPPDDLGDPKSDVKGWENGYWYNESIDVNQNDGVQADERKALVARTEARVEAIRCIEYNRTVPVKLISRQQYRRRQLNETVTKGLRRFDNAKFEALFLINESADSIAVQNRNRASGVLGYYSPKRDQISVIAESAKTLRMNEITLAHELVHAWQDQRYNLSGMPFAAKLRDQVNARNGIIEGDARYTEDLYRERCSAGWNCLSGSSGGNAGRLANIGVYLLKYQPYSDGPAFVRMARNIGGWSAVDHLYRDPPASTEQVIHPQKYDADAPTNVSLRDQTNGSWQRVRPPKRPDYGQLGEAALMAMFIYPYYDSHGRTEVVPPAQWFNRNQSGDVSRFDPLNYESSYSTGWDGDRLYVYRNDSGQLGYVWKLAWDSPQDAQQFRDGYQKVLRYWGGRQVGPNVWRIPRGGFADAFYVDVTGTTVTIVNAPTVGQLSNVRSSIGPVTVTNATAVGNATAGGNATAAGAGSTTAAGNATTPSDSATLNVTANATTTSA